MNLKNAVMRYSGGFCKCGNSNCPTGRLLYRVAWCNDDGTAFNIGSIVRYEGKIFRRLFTNYGFCEN